VDADPDPWDGVGGGGVLDVPPVVLAVLVLTGALCLAAVLWPDQDGPGGPPA
jgi:hypothetical protein